MSDWFFNIVLFCCLFVCYLSTAIKGISEDDTTAKEGLLLWCRKKTAGQNFTTHWKNGLAFCALIHKHQPHLIDYDSLDKNDAAKNLELAFSVAEGLGIPRLLDVEDMLVDKPDERSIMTQVSEYFHRFAQQDVKEVAARRAANFLGFTKKMNQLKHDYEACAKALLEWVQSIIDRFANENLGSTLEESVAATERLRSFILNEKPAKTAEKLDLESKYAEIQQTLLVHDRPAYDCPKEFAPETLDSAFDALWDSEKKHATAARVQRFKFISKQESTVGEDKLKEMKESYAHFGTKQHEHTHTHTHTKLRQMACTRTHERAQPRADVMHESIAFSRLWSLEPLECAHRFVFVVCAAALYAFLVCRQGRRWSHGQG